MRKWIGKLGKAAGLTRQAFSAFLRAGARLWRETSGGLRSRARSAAVQWTLIARTRAEAGMSTAEYAVGTIAACAFAGLLFKIVTSGEVRGMMTALIQKALKLAG
ncbi:DUF4244 domain-containing protein [Microtetraspora sp. NBRC 16547]|uniref:DUF4244 domain-containing protein n=1 Tax=Microtetraspora sp. NBRC 16547 TaxID=3030993 RepID=UPI0024A0BFE8|nr:hypothetical protein Misp02_24080 [Microtetraspora sp. NBRC 16547]